MADAVIFQLSAERFKRLGRGFEAYITQQSSLVLTHPWVEKAMEQDKRRDPAMRRLWRPVRTYGTAENTDRASGLEVANPIAIEDLFPPAVARDLTDAKVNCVVEYLDAHGRALKRALFRSLLRHYIDRHEFSLHKQGSKWYMVMYLGLGHEVPLGTVRLVLALERSVDGEVCRSHFTTIPVVRDKRTDGEVPEPQPDKQRILR